MADRDVSRRRWVLGAAVAMGLWAGCGRGQTQVPAQQDSTRQVPAEQVPAEQTPVVEGQEGYRLQVHAQRVVLDVVVRDKHGANVTGLSKDDFSVFEDKMPQEIRSFEETVPRAPGAGVAIHSTAELDRLEPEAPVSILVIDEVTTTFEDLAFARYSLKKYLKGRGDTLEQPTMLVAANFRGIAVLRDYTTSRAAILEALDRHLANYPALELRNSMTWLNDLVNATFRSLIGVAEATAGHPGHKNMIWIGRGFPPVFMSLLQPGDVDSFKTQLASCTRLLRDSRVTLTTVDPVGVSPYQRANDGSIFSFVGDPFAGQVDMDKIAVSTGGRAMHGRNDLNNVIDESVRDGEFFYTLAYRPSNDSQDPMEFRNIRVVMRGKSLKANSREGYFVAAAPVTPLLAANGKYSKRVVFDFNVASMNLLDYDGVDVRVTRDATLPDNFSLHVRAADLSLQTDDSHKQSAELTVAVVSFDRKGSLIAHHESLVTAQVAESPSRKGLDTGSISIPVSIATQEPAARIRFVVRANGSGKMGAANYFLVDRNKLSDPATGVRPSKASQ